jgi:hypothetical protein
MDPSGLGITYHCPLKTSSLKNTTNGKFCGQCSKHIPDMRNCSPVEVINQINNSTGEFCGTFDPIQLQNPYGDKRDKIVNWYQKFVSGQKPKLILLLAFILLIITGCRTRTRGVVGYSYDGMPRLRVHPRSVIEFTESSDFVKHYVYKIHLKAKKEKTIKKNKYKVK